MDIFVVVYRIMKLQVLHQFMHGGECMILGCITDYLHSIKLVHVSLNS